MKAFLKTIVGGALGLGALYFVGRICYEAGKNVAEVENQLENSGNKDELDKALDASNMVLDVPISCDDTVKVHHVEPLSAPEQKTEIVGFFDKVQNAKMFLAIRKVFDKRRDRPKGILGSLLTNPDGAKIEAVVKDGGVQISVKPRAA